MGLINASGGEVATCSTSSRVLSCALCSDEYLSTVLSTPRDCALPLKHHVCDTCLEKVSGNGLLQPTERSCPLCIFSITAMKFEPCDLKKIKKYNDENILRKKNCTVSTVKQFTLYTKEELLNQRSVFLRYLENLHIDLLSRPIIENQTICAFNPHTMTDEDFLDLQFRSAATDRYNKNVKKKEANTRRRLDQAKEQFEQEERSRTEQRNALSKEVEQLISLCEQVNEKSKQYINLMEQYEHEVTKFDRLMKEETLSEDKEIEGLIKKINKLQYEINNAKFHLELAEFDVHVFKSSMSHEGMTIFKEMEDSNTHDDNSGDDE